MANSGASVGLAALASANKDIICTAKRESVRKTTMREVLASSRLRIPIFQRRYCWGSRQWDLLLNDALAHLGHDLGRLTVYEVQDEARGRVEVMVSDGQQRCTTSLLLLAVIRDAALELHCSEGDDLAGILDNILMPDKEALKAWAAAARQGDGSPAPQGTDLPFCALSPTYFDRKAFYAALLPPALAGLWKAQCRSEDSSCRPLEAKQHLRAALQQRLLLEECSAKEAARRLEGAAEGVLSFKWLYFAVNVAKGQADSTENVTIIFTRMAWRDEMLRQFMASRSDEGVNLGAGDFIRSLLLGSFRRENDAITMYQKYWLVLEEKAGMLAAKSGRKQDTAGQHLEKLLSSFLAVQPEIEATAPAASPIGIPGQQAGLYGDFQAWLRVTIAGGADADAQLADPAAVEEGTTRVLERLSAFARSYEGHSDSATQPVLKQPMRPPALKSTGRKRGLGAWTPAALLPHQEVPTAGYSHAGSK